MPRYYFHQEDGHCYPDEDGAELAGMEEARRVALQAFTETVREHGADFWSTGSWRMTVADADGLTLFTLELTAMSAPAIVASRPPSPAVRD